MLTKEIVDRSELISRDVIGSKQVRDLPDFVVERASINEEQRTVEVAFSSEFPVERWWGTEILDHSPKSVRLKRMNNGGALLFNHDTDQHIGVVEKARVDSDKVARAVVRFGNSPMAEQKFQDVKDEILRHISVGYMIHKIESVKDGKGENEIERVVDWEPIEISFVPVPADPSVGVGRSDEDKRKPEQPRVTQEEYDAVKAKVAEAEQRASELTTKVADLEKTNEVLRLSNDKLKREIEDVKAVAEMDDNAHAEVMQRFKSDLSESAKACSDSAGALYIYRKRSETISESAATVPVAADELARSCEIQSRELLEACSVAETLISQLGGSTVLDGLAKSLRVIERRHDFVNSSATNIKNSVAKIGEDAKLQTEGIESVIASIEGVSRSVGSVVADFGRRLLLRSLK